MRRIALIVAAVLAAAGLGVGATLEVQGMTRVPDANPRGIPVVCERQPPGYGSAHQPACWQAGHRVKPPYSACDLGRKLGEETGEIPAWQQLDTTGWGTKIFVCGFYE